MDPNDLKKETLDTAHSYIDNLISGIDMLYNGIQRGEEGKSANLLGQFLEGLEWLINAIKLTGDVQRTAINVEEIDSVLNELESSMSRFDYNFMSDLLKYELKPILLKWKGMM